MNKIRKILMGVMCISILFCMFGCTSKKATVTEVAPSEKYKTKPYAKVDFIQGWFCSNWSQSKWATQIDKLKDVGIDQIILQDTSTEDKNTGKETSKLFPDGENSTNNTVGNILKIAQEKGVKVWIGCNSNDKWWDNGFLNTEWAKNENDICKTNMQRCYDLYKKKYPDAFYGFYYSWEMYNKPAYTTKWADMFNGYIENMNSIDPSLPIMFSPFLSDECNTTPEDTGNMYKAMFSKINFRKGDIFCPQSCWSSESLTHDQYISYVENLAEATKENPNLRFGMNVESFVGNEEPADSEKWQNALKEAATYTDFIASFSISHVQLLPKEGRKDSYDALKTYVDQVNSDWH